MKDTIKKELESHRSTIEKVIEVLTDDIHQAAQMAVETINNQKKIIICGNGGSAADAQHIAAELSGRFKKERRGLPAIAITTDTSALTAIGNDYGFEHIFRRQVEALANAGDLIIGISTSGNSPNIIKALEAGKTLGCRCLGLSGNGGGKMNTVCDLNIIIPSNDTPRIQEMHILIGHTLCYIIENNLV